jgi:hypothetical protein
LAACAAWTLGVATMSRNLYGMAIRSLLDAQFRLIRRPR